MEQLIKQPSNGNGNGHALPTNGNGNGHKNGNGHHDNHQNGNGHNVRENGNGHTTLLTEDRFAYLESIKPRLFPSKEEVIEKTGIRRNLLLFILFLVAAVYISSLPLSSSVTDRNALVVPIQRTDLTSPKDAFVKRVFFQEGEQVKKGALLLKVMSSQDHQAVKETRLEVLSLEKELSQVWLESQVWVLRLDEAIRLKKIGSIKPYTFQEALLRNEASQRKVESLIFKLEAAREKEHFLRQYLKEGEIRAPFDGLIISDAKLKEKAFVKQGEFLLTLATQKSQVEFLLKETDYSRISIGAKARIKFYAFPEDTYEGHVIGIKPFAEPLPKSAVTKHMIKVLIRWNQAPEQIQNGMSAKVSIEAKSKSVLGRVYHEIF